jgi:hypothetical protein
LAACEGRKWKREKSVDVVGQEKQRKKKRKRKMQRAKKRVWEN